MRNGGDGGGGDRSGCPPESSDGKGKMKGAGAGLSWLARARGFIRQMSRD